MSSTTKLEQLARLSQANPRAPTYPHIAFVSYRLKQVSME